MPCYCRWLTQRANDDSCVELARVDSFDERVRLVGNQSERNLAEAQTITHLSEGGGIELTGDSDNEFDARGPRELGKPIDAVEDLACLRKEGAARRGEFDAPASAVE